MADVHNMPDADDPREARRLRLHLTRRIAPAPASR